MFSLSAFVIGPAISGDGSSNPPAPTETPSDHSEHHSVGGGSALALTARNRTPLKRLSSR
jgi:hypothetical protein